MEDKLAQVLGRIDAIDRRLTRQEELMYGDSEARLHGVLVRLENLETYIDELQELIKLFRARVDLTLTFVRLGLVLMGFTTLGTWWPFVVQLVELYTHGP